MTFLIVLLSLAVASCEDVTPTATDQTPATTNEPPDDEPIEEPIEGPETLASFADLACTVAHAAIAKPPEPPINLRGFPVGSGGYELRWERALWNPDHWFAITFVVARQDGTTWNTVTSGSYRPLSYSGTASAGNHRFRVLSVNRCDQESTTGAFVNVEIGDAGPAPARYLTATVAGEHTLDLIWRGITTPSSVVYQVERKTDSTSWAQTHTVTDGGWSYVDKGLDSGTSYQYRVWSAVPDGTSHDRAGVSTNIATATTMPAGSTSVPSAPRMFRAIATGRSWIDLAWVGPERDGNSRVTGYTIQVREDGEWATIGTTVHAVTIRHRDLELDTRYIYRVRANNEKVSGDGGNWTTGAFRTDAIGQPAPHLIVLGQQDRDTVLHIILEWTMPSDWFEAPDGHNRAIISRDDYTAERKVNNGSWGPMNGIAIPFARYGRTMENSELSFDTRYSYRVRYKDSPWSNECSISFTASDVTSHTTLQKTNCR